MRKLFFISMFAAVAFVSLPLTQLRARPHSGGALETEPAQVEQEKEAAPQPSVSVAPADTHQVVMQEARQGEVQTRPQDAKYPWIWGASGLLLVIVAVGLIWRRKQWQETKVRLRTEPRRSREDYARERRAFRYQEHRQEDVTV